MCGLVLLVNKNQNGFSSVQNEVFDTLLYLSGHFRGRDGAGVVAVDNIGNVMMAKAALTVDEMIRKQEYIDVAKSAWRNGWAMMGHNRAATRGVVSDENSHPFVVDDKIVLMHNGTFNSDHKELKETEVDSEAIAHVLVDHEDVEQALRKVNAAYALIWYNVDKKEINVIRNNSRPLWYMETSDSYIYASDESFLNFVKDKFKLTIKAKAFEIKESQLNTYTLNDKRTDFESSDVDVSYWKHKIVTQVTGGHPGNGLPFHPDAGSPNGVFGNIRRAFWPGSMGTDYDDGDDGDVGPVFTQPHRDIIINTKNPAVCNKIIDALGKVHTPVTNLGWRQLMDMYKKSEKIKVFVDDLVEADDYPKTKNFIVMGKTLDENRVHVCFPMKDVEFEKLQELMADAVFEIAYSGITWHRITDPDNLKEKNIDKFKGLALMHGLNPTPIYLAASNEHAY